MALFREAIHRDTILFINRIRPSTIEAIETYRDRYDKAVKILIIVDRRKKKFIEESMAFAKSKKVTVVTCNTDSPVQVKQVLAPYIDRLLAVSTQFENSVPELKRILPHVPYLNGPTQESLDWSTDKVKMRRMLRAHKPGISPRFTVIKDNSKESVAQVGRIVGYPLVVKPAGLAASILVSVCYHEEELEQTLKFTFKKLERIYKEKLGRGTPQILVEQMMEGTMYSIDSYVNDRGNIYHTPPVHIKTGRSLGFDDFFGYQRITPTKLTKPKIEDAEDVCEDAIKAIGLRSTSVHTELMKTDKGWKIIELAPRMGGYRQTMYGWSFGINHILNDILIRIPQKPVIPRKRKGFTAVFNMYGKSEGKLESIRGIKKVKALNSFVHLNIKKHKDDVLLFAKNGGGVVLEISLYNKNRPDLLADIRRMEKAVEIVVAPKRRTLTNRITEGVSNIQQKRHE